MDFEEYKHGLKNRVLLVCLLAVVIVVGQWLGLLEVTGSDLPARLYGAPILTALIAAGWLVIAAVGAVGLYRWLRS